eukprot:5878962-Pyramimonas_sp.AAC.1
MLTGAGGKRCTTCAQWAEMAPRISRAESNRSRVFARTSKCNRRAGPAPQRKSREESQGWQKNAQEMQGALRRMPGISEDGGRNCGEPVRDEGHGREALQEVRGAEKRRAERVEQVAEGGGA